MWSDSDICTINFRAYDIQFLKHDIELLPTSHLLHLSNYIAITLILSKHDEVYKTIIMHTANNPELCPFNLWPATIYHLHYYPRFDPRWPVSTLFDEKKSNITSLDVRNNIHCAVRDIGKDKLSFTEYDVGTHSNRLSDSTAV